MLGCRSPSESAGPFEKCREHKKEKGRRQWNKEQLGVIFVEKKRQTWRRRSMQRKESSFSYVKCNWNCKAIKRSSSFSSSSPSLTRSRQSQSVQGQLWTATLTESSWSVSFPIISWLRNHSVRKPKSKHFAAFSLTVQLSSAHVFLPSEEICQRAFTFPTL